MLILALVMARPRIKPEKKLEIAQTRISRETRERVLAIAESRGWHKAQAIRNILEWGVEAGEQGMPHTMPAAISPKPRRKTTRRTEAAL